MMLSIHPRRARLAALAVPALALAFALALRAHADRPAQATPMTASEVLDRTAPLCQAVLLDEPDVRLVATATRASDLTAPPFTNWSVDCYDSSGRRVAGFEWNADTDSLWSVTRLARPEDAVPGPPLSKRQAIWSSWCWLQTLGIAGTARGWHLVDAPERTVDRSMVTWLTRWRAGTRSAAVMVRGRASELVRLTVWPAAHTMDLAAAPG